jgi:pimeloyl-ACP methyl ester carboxylesterase
MTQVVKSIYLAGRFHVLEANRDVMNQGSRSFNKRTWREDNMHDQRVHVDDIELQIREYERESEAVIFLHFGGGNLMMWQRVVPLFQDSYRLILVDLRGHGKSDKPRWGNHIDKMAEDVVGMMEFLELDQAHIIGSSLGAEVGLSLAANYPARVTSLVCEGALYSEFGPYGIWDGSEADFKQFVDHQLTEARERAVLIFPSVEALVEARRKTFEKQGWWNPYIEQFLVYDACEIGAGKYSRSLQKWAQEEYLEHYFGYRFEDYYRRVKCPVLLLPGEEELQDDRIRKAMEGLSKLAHKARIVAVAGWEHPFGWLVDVDKMCKVVLEFLAETGVADSRY